MFISFHCNLILLTLICNYLKYFYLILDTSTMRTFHFHLLSLTMALVFVTICAQEDDPSSEGEGDQNSGNKAESGNAAALVYPHVFTAIVSFLAYAIFK